jgi:hypothetical protein
VIHDSDALTVRGKKVAVSDTGEQRAFRAPDPSSALDGLAASFD